MRDFIEKVRASTSVEKVGNHNQIERAFLDAQNSRSNSVSLKLRRSVSFLS